MKRIMIGITGGIGSGKSEASAYLRKRGEQVICADEVAREVVRPGESGAAAVREAFGGAYFLPDGSLNRAKLAQRVFEQTEDLKRLNSMLHPLILEHILEKTSGMKDRVFIDAALLIETGMNEYMDYVWVITADQETRICRVMERDDAPREAVESRIKSQLSDSRREEVADEVIHNDAGLDELHRRIDCLLQKEKYNEVTL